MPRTEGQFTGIREQKINLIMQTALELFANEGYYPTSISKIAKKAGISKGLMYNYFESKEKLILALIVNGINKVTESIDPDHDGILTKDEFEYLVNDNFRILEENPNYWKLYFATMMQPTVFKMLGSVFSDLVPPLKAVVGDYFKRKGSKDPEAEASFFFAVLDGIFLNYVMDPAEFPLERIKAFIIEKFG
jgi:AcrR family transcriptional regulator